MKLIAIHGPLWKLTRQQVYPFGNPMSDCGLSENSQNINALHGRNLDNRGTGRLLEGNKIRSEAIAIIEKSVNGLQDQSTHVIYFCSKGYYCLVQRKRVYLLDILQDSWKL